MESYAVLPDVAPLHKPPPPPVEVPLVPPLLKQRMEQYGIEFPPWAATFDRIFVYPLDLDTQPDTTAGGIVIPSQLKQKMVAQIGVIIMAGPRAIEQLYSHGLELGDVLVCARMSPWERPYYSKTKRPHRVLVLRSSEVVASQELMTKLYETHELSMWMDHEGRVTVGDRERIDPPESDEGI